MRLMRVSKKSRANIRNTQAIKLIHIQLTSTHISNITSTIYQHHHFPLHLGNILLSNRRRINLANTNCAGMENVLFSTITIGSEDLAKSKARLDDTLIHKTKRALSLIDGDTVIGNSPSGVIRVVTT